MKLLLVSNGHGEDAIGARLAAELRALHPAAELEAVPLVGRGRAYERAGVRVSGPRRDMPSGGFMLTGPGVLARDLRAGFITMSREQYRAIRASRADAVIVTGDVYALWAALRFAAPGATRPPVFQVQPLVSLYYQDGFSARDRLERVTRATVDGFVAAERALMRRARRVWARDERSAAWLRDHGVPHAACAGNLMMDLVAEPEIDPDVVRRAAGPRVVTLLPGTRDDYLFSLPIMLRAVQDADFAAVAAFPGPLERVPLPPGWSWVDPTPPERAATAERAAAHASGRRVPVLRRAFAAALHASSAAIGTSGTANEQAAGLGVPVVAFPTRGPQYLPAFARAQRRLLGDALELVPPDPGAVLAATRAALEDDAFRARARRAGAERMGGPGAARRVAVAVLEELRGPERRS